MKRSRRFCGSGLLLSQTLAFAWLAACLWWVWQEVAIILPNDRITASLSVEQSLGGALRGQLAAFGVALLLTHALLGFVAFGFARLTEAACNGPLPARRGWLICGWFIWLVGLAAAANAVWHPSSRFANPDSWFLAEIFGIPAGKLLLVATGLILAAMVVRAVPRPSPRMARAAALGVCGAAFLSLVSHLLPLAKAGPAHRGAPGAPPHVIIIGLDSLRTDLTESQSGTVITPNIDEFLRGAHRFSDAITPLARTYGSWVSILTGRHPVSTGARYNLMPRSLVDDGVTLADALRSKGYRTIYATDEVRFANIDESFGFDQLITPPIGAGDFLLGYAGDMPLVNLVGASPAGRWLYPANHANRAAHASYRPRDFVARLAREVSVERPTFLAVHLTLSHWPYNWAGIERPTAPPQYRLAYRRANEEVDRQFRQVLSVLARKGALENAIVVVLSDHGEALGAETDSMLRKTGNSREIWDSLWGHGTSVMSPHQYSVVLAMRAYGRARLPAPAVSHDWPVSLEDVRPTLEELVTGSAPHGVDGVSLVPYLESPERGAQLAGRVRFTETDFNTPSTLAGRYEASGIIDEAAVYYELHAETGWMQLRQDKLPVLLERKQRAAISAGSLLAAIPDPDGRNLRFLFTGRHDPLPRAVEGRPDPAQNPEAARLWDALQARFPGELPQGPGLP